MRLTCYAKSDGITVKQHCAAVAKLACKYGSEIGFSQTAYIAGLCHDIGKYGPDFQDVLAGVKTGVDHACAGACLFDLATKHRFRHIAEAIAAHHGSLNCYEYLSGVFRGMVMGVSAVCPSGKQASLVGRDGFNRAAGCFRQDWPDLRLSGIEKLDCDFSSRFGKLRYMLVVRMLLSCLVDADYKVSGLERDVGPVDGVVDLIDESGDCIDVNTALTRLDTYRSNIIYDSQASSGVGRLRDIVYQDCRRAGMDVLHDFYTLTAPTGSGKTLGMLRFALERCKRDSSKRRIIIALPFLSISDQVEKIVREIIPDAIVDNSQSDLDESGIEIASRWSAPCVITTTVRLFKSLFSDRPGDCRRLHRIANSVILFDEVQSLPVELSRVLIESLQVLAENYNACICLSTATQPAYGRMPGLDFQAQEIIHDTGLCFGMTKRTRIVLDGEKHSLTDIASDAAGCDDVCVIVNLRAHAREIYDFWVSQGVQNCYLLSTDLCGEHRRVVLDLIREHQMKHEPVYVAATQCIEAGVDLDFERVFRALAPLPSLIQAAGRMNRNGLREPGVMRVFEPDCRSLYPGADYERQAVLVKVLASEGLDLNDLAGIETYYGRLFEGFEEPGVVQSSLDELDYAGFARATWLIKRSGYQVIVPYAGKMNAYDEILDAVLSGAVRKQHLRMSAGISVPVYDLSSVEAHCQELVIQNRRTGTEIHTGMYVLLTGHEKCYDARVGLRFGVDESMCML